ncbi:MAG: hypothetical protein Q9218_005753 [Villophora microphyllina]
MDRSDTAQDTLVFLQHPVANDEDLHLGKLNISIITHQEDFGGTTASPAATAAYLVHNPAWDDEAKKSIERSESRSPKPSIGAVPCLYPTPIIETSTGVLLQDDIVSEDVDGLEVDMTLSCPEQNSTSSSGTIEIEDHARIMLALNLSDRQVGAKAPLEHFTPKDGHISCIAGGSGKGFTINYDVLMSLLDTSDVQDHKDELEYHITSLCEDWWSDTMGIGSVSNQETMMLLAKALVRVLEIWDQGKIEYLPEILMQYKLPLTLVQICNRTLMRLDTAAAPSSDQLPDALLHAVSTLQALQSLPWPDGLNENLCRFTNKSQKTAQGARESWKNPQSFCQGEAAYDSELAKAYCMGATSTFINPYIWTAKVQYLFLVPRHVLQDVTRLFSQLPNLRGKPPGMIEASVYEGLMFLPHLQSHGKGFPDSRSTSKKDGYLAFIPSTCVVVNNLSCLGLPSCLLWEMMVWTLGLFRMDEYIETEIEDMSADDVEDLSRYITAASEASSPDADLLSSTTRVGTAEVGSGHITFNDVTHPNSDNNPQRRAEIHTVFRTYINSLLFNPLIATTPPSRKKPLRLALAEFLHAHLSQSLLNSDLASQTSRSTLYLSPDPPSTIPIYHTQQSFTSYMHNIGAPTFGTKVVFAYLVCLVGGLPTLKARYLGEEYAERIGRMSRFYNDLAGMERDRDEGNVNCVNFAEFHEHDHTANANEVGGGGEDGEKLVKVKMEQLARYEREEMGVTRGKLVEEIRRAGGEGWEKKVSAVRLVGEVAELYADIYVVRDLSNRIKGKEQ